MSKTAAQIVRFAVAGVAGLLVDIAVLYLARALGLGWYSGRVCSFLAAVWVTWQINRRYTFSDRAATSPWAEWWRYLLAMAGGGVVNYAAYSATVHWWPEMPFLPVVAVAIGSLAGMSINFLSAKLFVFRPT